VNEDHQSAGKDSRSPENQPEQSESVQSVAVELQLTGGGGRNPQLAADLRTEGRTRYRSGVDAARERQGRIRYAMERASVATLAGDLEVVLRLCTAAVDEIEDAWPHFSRDELALSDVIGTLAVAAAWCRTHKRPAPDAMKSLLERATGLRLRILDGGDE